MQVGRAMETGVSPCSLRSGTATRSGASRGRGATPRVRTTWRRQPSPADASASRVAPAVRWWSRPRSGSRSSGPGSPCSSCARARSGTALGGRCNFRPDRGLRNFLTEEERRIILLFIPCECMFIRSCFDRSRPGCGVCVSPNNPDKKDSGPWGLAERCSRAAIRWEHRFT